MAGPDRDASPSPPRVSLATVLVLVLVGLLGLLALALDYLSLWARMPLLDSDLWVFREGGRAFTEGGPLYFVTIGNNDWLYPPFGALVMAPLQLLPPEWLQPAWWLVSLALLAIVVAISFRPLLVRVRQGPGRALAFAGTTAAAVALAPSADALGLGQIGIILMALCLVDVVLLDGSRWQGALVGVAAAVKLTPLVFVVYFLAVRRWRAAATSAVAAAACWFVAALLRPDLWQQFVSERIAFRTTSMIQGFDRTDFNQSLRGMVDGLGQGPLVTGLWLVLSAAVLVPAVLAARRAHGQGQLVLAAALVGMASVLVSPISWHHHAVWVVPALGALIGDGRARWRCLVAGAGALLMVVPPRTSGLLELPGDRFVVGYLIITAGLIAVAWPPAETASVTADREAADAR
ncbi:MAG: glycosyltransferase 87 family protein [Candidatus Nanopelagicales bacterium]